MISRAVSPVAPVAVPCSPESVQRPLQGPDSRSKRQPPSGHWWAASQARPKATASSLWGVPPPLATNSPRLAPLRPWNPPPCGASIGNIKCPGDSTTGPGPRAFGTLSDIILSIFRLGSSMDSAPVTPVSLVGDETAWAISTPGCVGLTTGSPSSEGLVICRVGEGPPFRFPNHSDSRMSKAMCTARLIKNPAASRVVTRRLEAGGSVARGKSDSAITERRARRPSVFRPSADGVAG